jgi:hypothetical protein
MSFASEHREMMQKSASWNAMPLLIWVHGTWAYRIELLFVQ